MNTAEDQLSPEEIAEIARHKYFLSEKAGHDVGWETAQSDWELHYGSHFRQQVDADRKAGIAQTSRTWLQRLLASVGLG